LQIPPKVCALKIDGKRAYKLVKKGKDVELKARPITIYEFELLGYEAPKARFRALCSKGTYVRSLARDMGKMLLTVAHISALKRTMSGPFSLKNAIPLEDFLNLCHTEEALEKVLRPGVVLDDIPAISVSQEEACRLRWGQIIETSHKDAQNLVALCEDELIAIVACENGSLYTKRGFQEGFYR
ncbi:MAG TPA: tRNA pseudouridine(55) synthase TruB, partial [Alphaproteobacteria bacterium]|nr:tRNA pseudouridine(55) synthase TruB [Alphaproteobacteria bacterium]